ncbi:hypothetical protein TWF694_010889 [Orbilia ellipsospora]|uniref:Uncharacterized protein n=1 Tax=Orbilia ellipsospora TaxID=2528407 RepID=A0AAV9X8Q9_9PEZI
MFNTQNGKQVRKVELMVLLTFTLLERLPTARGSQHYARAVQRQQPQPQQPQRQQAQQQRQPQRQQAQQQQRPQRQPISNWQGFKNSASKIWPTLKQIPPALAKVPGQVVDALRGGYKKFEQHLNSSNLLSSQKVRLKEKSLKVQLGVYPPAGAMGGKTPGKVIKGMKEAAKSGYDPTKNVASGGHKVIKQYQSNPPSWPGNSGTDSSNKQTSKGRQ